MNRAADSLVGVWKLTDWTATVSGRTFRPFNGSATGVLIYTADGWMSATLMRQDRPHLQGRTLGTAGTEERATAASGYLAYTGTYQVNGDEVIHRVVTSLYPNWVGTEQRRGLRWDGETLVLTDYVDDEPDADRSTTLHWLRSHPGG